LERIDGRTSSARRGRRRIRVPVHSRPVAPDDTAFHHPGRGTGSGLRALPTCFTARSVRRVSRPLARPGKIRTQTVSGTADGPRRCAAAAPLIRGIIHTAPGSTVRDVPA
jgi:hypothetical protein